MLTFELPWAFALAPLPLLVRYALPPWLEPTPALRVPFFERSARASGQTPRPGALERRRGWMQLGVAILAWLLLVVAVARPQWLEPPIVRVQPARDLVLAVDVSQSMEAKDFVDAQGVPEDRLNAVKSVVREFVARRAKDRLALIAFGTGAFPQTPLTLDAKSVQRLLDELAIGSAGPQTAIGDALGMAVRMTEKSHAAKKVLVLLTDGNDTASRIPPARAAEIAREHALVVYTIGIGDPSATGEERVDFAALEKISDVTHGKSFRADDREGLASVYAEIDRINPAEVKRSEYRPKRELYFVPLAAGALVFALYHVLAWARAVLAR